MSTPTVRLWHLYPREMNIYADRGNIAVLRERLRRRALDLELREGGPGETAPDGGADLVYLGGGQDRDQLAVAADLAATKADAVRGLLGDGAVGLFVCGGYQLAGHSYRTTGGESVAGLGVLDITTTAGEGRLIGDIVLTSDLGAGSEAGRLVGYENHARRTTLGDGSETGRLVGYENHAGRTTLGDGAAALGRVVEGHGNNGRDRTEGAVANRTVGTYLHGPLLPKNPWLADLLLGWALEHRYGRSFDLEPLDDRLEQAAHTAAVARAKHHRR
ncbi:MAG: glutamine amidotransferase [bacterium]|nr:glutamine amidotransferase [bacterium]